MDGFGHGSKMWIFAVASFVLLLVTIGLWVFETIQGQSIGGKEAFFTAAGAFVGSLSAFSLEWVTKHQEERGLKIGSGRIAQVALNSQLNTLVSVRKQHFANHRIDLMRWIRARAFIIAGNPLRVDIKSISWLAENMEANVLAKAMIAEQCYDTFLHALDHRNQLWNQAKDQVFLFKDGDFKCDDVGLIMDLVRSTDEVYRCLDDAIASLVEAINGLHVNFKSKWPSELFYKANLDETIAATPEIPKLADEEDFKKKQLEFINAHRMIVR